MNKLHGILYIILLSIVLGIGVALSQSYESATLEADTTQQGQIVADVVDPVLLHEALITYNQKRNLKLYLMALDVRKDTKLTESVIDVIIEKCYEITENGKKCVEDIIGVSNAESSIFKRGLYNNYLGVMQSSSQGLTLKRYDSLEDAVSDWIIRYQRNGWYKFTNNSGRVGKYCGSACTYRYPAYDKGVKELYLADIQI